MEWRKSKRNAMTREARSLYSVGAGPVDPEGCKGAGISIPSQMCMICMIKRGSTRLKVGGAGLQTRGPWPTMCNIKYST